ncbi:MAG: methylenetetrahydrofolate reductase C-terminal domain-containing protein [bacterium]
MIIAEWKPIPELIETVREYERILLVGCATCVAECAAGGEREVETLAPLMRMGCAASGSSLEVVTRTLERQCEWEFVEALAPLIGGVEAVVSLACGIGVQTVAERFPEATVYPGVNTTSLAVRAEAGLWLTRCAACGDCRLGETFGLCSVSRCAKSLANGPCGGTRPDGRCEVDVDKDCVWQQIVRRAMDRDALQRLMEVRPAKDWSGGCHGEPIRMVKEDHQA